MQLVVIFGGGIAPTILNDIDYITTTTLGNAQNFGDLTSAYIRSISVHQFTQEVLFAGGYSGPVQINLMDYINNSN